MNICHFKTETFEQEQNYDIPAFLRDNVVITKSNPARRKPILVIGVGGAGSNYVQHLSTRGMSNVDCVIADTDNNHISALERTNQRIRSAKQRRQEADLLQRFLLTSNAKSPLWSEITQLIRKYRLVVINAGLGGYSGSMLVPMLADVAQQAGTLPVAHCSTPEKTESSDRRGKSEEVIQKLSKLDCYTLVHENEMIDQYEDSTTNDRFQIVHELFDQEITALLPLASQANDKITNDEVRHQRQQKLMIE